MKHNGAGPEEPRRPAIEMEGALHGRTQYVPPPPRGYDDDRRGYDQRGYDPRYGGKPYRKQKHWLSEIFD